MDSKTILSIETSSNVCGIAITTGLELIAIKEDFNFRKHVEVLPSLYKNIMDESNFSLKKIDAIAVSIGPGSFTGLRIGLGFAKGIAYSHGLSIIPVPTFLSLAYSLKSIKPSSGIILSHGKKVFYQEFGWSKETPSPQLPPIVFDIDTVKNEKEIIFQSNCESILQSDSKIKKAVLTSENIGYLSNINFDNWRQDKPYQLVPDYIANFNTDPVG